MNNFLSIPNLLSSLRLFMAPLMLLSARMGRGDFFVGVFVAALFTDWLDGFLARRMKMTTELGARLDSWGDLMVYLCMPLAIWWLWPEIIRQEAPWIITAICSFSLPVFVGFAKFRRLTSYHTRGAKLSAALLSGSTLILIMEGPSWPFRLSTLVLVAAALEEIAITVMLSNWQADVPSLIQALPSRRRRRKK